MPEEPAAGEPNAVEYVLAVGIYGEPADALADLRDLTNPGPLVELIVGTAVLTRGLRRGVLQQGGGGSTAFGAGTGAALGIVAGVLLPLGPLGALAGGVGGGAIGAVLGRRVQQEEAGALVGLLDVDLSIGETALIAVVAEAHAPEVRAAMHRARRTTGRLVADRQTRRVIRGLVRGNPEATEALGG
ncbi:MAG TPA: hypothetical protein VF143_07850 [Candidatus Nanopelagicales bacterium]